MRGTTSLILTIVILLVVLVVYVLLGRSQMTGLIRRQRAELSALEARRLQIAKYETEMYDMTQNLPDWRAQLTLFKRAIPEKIDDDKFIGSINEQLAQNNVKLLSIDVAVFGSWLKDVDEQTIEKLRAAGLDVDTMRKIQVAFYDIRLTGDFKDVITSFENMKRYGRLYTIDMVTTEGQGGGGAVTEILNPGERPLMVSGAIFYGVPEGYLNTESLERQFARRFTGPLARNIFQNILQQAGKSVESEQSDVDDADAAKPPANGGAEGNSSSTSGTRNTGAAAAQGV